MDKPRPIRRNEVKKLSIIRNPGTGPLLERLREKPMSGPIGFHRPERLDDTPYSPNGTVTARK